MAIKEAMTNDCLWLSQQGDSLKTRTRKGRPLILDADWTALEMEDKTVRVDVFTFISCAGDHVHARDIDEIIGNGPFQNFLFFKDRWNIDGGFYQDFADIDMVLTDYPGYHDKITCADYAKTLLNYMQAGGRKQIDWGWLYARIRRETSES
jgi:hypothetical protein